MASGSDQSNIVFTSYNDDSFGGDTNGDGSTSVPNKGDWYCLESYTGGTINLNYCRIRFGGKTYAMAYSSGGGLYVDHSIIEQSNTRGIEIKGSGSVTNNQLSYFIATGVYVNSGSPEISGNNITGGSYGIYIIGGSSNISSNSISNFSHTGIYVSDSSPAISQNNVSGGSYGIYVLNGTANINSNTISNFSNTGIYVRNYSSTISQNNVTGGSYGLYVLNGSPNINSNTINNSNNTGIYISSGSPAITDNTLNGGSGNNKGIVVNDGTVTIENNNISQYPNYEAIQLGSSSGTVSGSVYGNIISCCKYPFGFAGDKIPSITFNDNDISGCSHLGIHLNLYLSSCTIPVYSLPYIVTDISVKTGATVNISPGAIFKLRDDITITVFGTLNVEGNVNNPVVFTSLKDDFYGGDTNKDGTATTPQPNDWNMIHLADNAKAYLNYAIIRYGRSALDINDQSSELSVYNCDISSSSWGLDIYDTSKVNVIGNKIYHNGRGIYSSNGSSPLIINNEIYDNGHGIDIFRSSAALVMGNNIHHNRTGIQIMMQSGDHYGCNISYNNIENNSYYGFENWSANQPPVAVAENNWWGSESGPSPIGSGDKINSTTLVDVSPWLKTRFVPPAPESLLGNRHWDFKCNDPVNAVTGNFTYEKKDIEIPTRGESLTFARFYNSLDSRVGPLGKGWQHNYNCTITINEDNSATVLYPDGHQETFPYDNDTYIRPLACFETLTRTDEGFLLTFKDQTIFVFNSSGVLTAIKDKNNNTNSLIYSGSLLQSVTEPGGRVLGFQYWPDNKLKQVIDPAGRTVSFTYDGSGNLTSCTDVNGGVWNYDYSEGLLSSIVDPRNNHIVTNIYDTNGRVVKQTDGENHVTAFNYDPVNRINTITDPLGNKATLSYDPLYRITSIDYPEGIQESFHYDANNNRTGVKDKNGNTTVYTYDDMGNMLTKTVPAPLNYVTIYTYDSFNNPTRVIDEGGYATDYTYDAKGNLLTVSRAVYGGIATTSFADNEYGQVTGMTDPNGKISTINYDLYGNQSSVTDPLGYTTTYTYDIIGRGLTKTDPLGRTTSYTFDAAGNVVTVTDPLGNVTTNTYDLKGNRISATDPKGNTTTFAYNQNDKLITTIDPLGKTTTYSYDAENNLASVTDANGHTATYHYDFLNRLISTTDPSGKTEAYTLDGNGNQIITTERNGNTTTYTYDALNRLTKVTDALGNAVVMEYDSLGNKTSVTDQRGNTTRYTYDQGSRLLSVYDPLDHTTNYTYDLADNVTSVIDASGARWQYSYDDANRLITVTDPPGNVSRTEYDSVGNAVYSTDANNSTITFAYDQLNRLVSVTDALGHTASYTYDENGNLSAYTDARGKVSTFDYDASNRLVSATDPLGNIIQRTYDPAGNLAFLTRPDGSSINYSYDVNNRLTGITYPDGTRVTYAHDVNGNRTSMTDPSGVTSYDYDNLGHITAVSRNNNTLSYDYDPAGNITGITYPGGFRVSYDYNALNLPTSVSDSVYSTTITYDETGKRIKESLPNGVTVDYSYDIGGRLTGLQHTSAKGVIAASEYTLDKVGNRLSKTDEQGKTTSYSYNNLYQLTRVEYPDGQAVDYTYDPAGNRTGAGGVTYTFDDANRLIQVGIVPYGYNTNGNLISVGQSVYYDYDYENRLVSYMDENKSAHYTYDGDGNRTCMSVSGAVYGNYEYIYDINAGLPKLLVEKDSSGEENNYIYAGRILSGIGLAGQLFYHQDGLGSISVVSDVYGNPLNCYTYDAFGSPRSVSESVYNPFMFTGEPYDPSGLIYLRARYYDPATGRFLSQDTYPGELTDPLSRNKYVYCRNNPILYIDPSGHMTLCEAWENFNKGIGVAATGETYGKSWEVVKENFPKGFKEFGTQGLLGVDPDTFDRYINGQMSKEEFDRTTEIIAINLALMGRGKALGLGGRGAIKAEFTSIKAGAKSAGKGFNSFSALKKFLGSPGEDKVWHHIVEQSQINKSGLSPTQINNTENIIAVDSATHAKISGYYSSKQAFTEGNTVRDWLAGQSYEKQFKFGMQKLRDFGVVK